MHRYSNDFVGPTVTTWYLFYSTRYTSNSRPQLYIQANIQLGIFVCFFFYLLLFIHLHIGAALLRMEHIGSSIASKMMTTANHGTFGEVVSSITIIDQTCSSTDKPQQSKMLILFIRIKSMSDTMQIVASTRECTVVSIDGVFVSQFSNRHSPTMVV